MYINITKNTVQTLQSTVNVWAVLKSTFDWLVKINTLSKHHSAHWIVTSNCYRRTRFSLHSLEVITDETWTLLSSLLHLWGMCCDSCSSCMRTKCSQHSFFDCVMYMVIMFWVTVEWENGAENSGMGALMCMTNAFKDDTQLWLTNSFKKL
jgi:hypothetical protein